MSPPLTICVFAPKAGGTSRRACSAFLFLPVCCHLWWRPTCCDMGKLQRHCHWAERCNAHVWLTFLIQGLLINSRSVWVWQPLQYPPPAPKHVGVQLVYFACHMNNHDPWKASSRCVVVCRVHAHVLTYFQFGPLISLTKSDKVYTLELRMCGLNLRPPNSEGGTTPTNHVIYRSLCGQYTRILIWNYQAVRL